MCDAFVDGVASGDGDGEKDAGGGGGDARGGRERLGEREGRRREVAVGEIEGFEGEECGGVDVGIDDVGDGVDAVVADGISSEGETS